MISEKELREQHPGLSDQGLPYRVSGGCQGGGDPSRVCRLVIFSELSGEEA